ncbi:MAG: hypothetical protein M3P04_10015, partial [Actinomycetota bacterium]|nr:hypothetical protein [Actinomycetota bacterium]
MKRVLLVALMLVLAAAPARAEDATEVAAALRTSPVYQAAHLDLVDVATLTGELSATDPRVVVAVLDATAASSAEAARRRAVDISNALAEPETVVLVITANKHVGAAHGSRAGNRGVDSGDALAEELKDFGSKPFTKDVLTAFVTSFAERVADQASSSSGVGSDGDPVDTGGGSGAWVLGGLVVVGAAGAGVAFRASRQRRKRLNEALRAEVEQLYERLGADVLNLDARDNAVARQALADAAERYSACGGQLSSADTPAEFAAARRTAVEGLTAARTARTALGLDPGPEIPLVPGSGPQLEGSGQVTVGGQTYDGSPTYTPGQPHYYRGGPVGGQQVPGGWYSGNFWEPFLLGSILTGGFGGDHGGFERGYDEGQRSD